jgi:hypothetical protein
VSAKTVLGASARIYLLPVAGLLAGAGIAQLAAAALFSPAAGGNAAGIGGIAGAVLAVLVGRRLASRRGAGAQALPRVAGILAAAPAGEPFCDGAPGRHGASARVDAPGAPRVE